MTKPTQLFEESLVEAKKLREVAQKEAEKAIISDISPFIKEMIEKELAGKVTSFLFEAEGDDDDPLYGKEENLPAPTPVPTEQPSMVPNAAPVAPPPITPATDTGVDVVPPAVTDVPMTEPATPPSLDSAPAEVLPPPPDSMAGMADQPLPAPETGSATPTTPEELPPVSSTSLNLPMPDEAGKVTVDFEELFLNSLGKQAGDSSSLVTPEIFPGEEGTKPMTPEEMGAPPIDAASINQQQELQPELPENEFDSFRESVEHLEAFVLEHTGLPKQAEKPLIYLFEYLEEKANSSISPRLKKLFETRLENLYKKLFVNSEKDYSYMKINLQEGKKDMSSLRQFAKALFEDASAGFGDGGQAKDEIVNSLDGSAGETASKHAKEASDSTPVEDPGKKDSLKVPGDAIVDKKGTTLDEELELEIADDEIVQEAKKLRAAKATKTDKGKTNKKPIKEMDETLMGACEGLGEDLSGELDINIDLDAIPGEDDMAGDLFGSEATPEAAGDEAGEEEGMAVSGDTDMVPSEEPSGFDEPDSDEESTGNDFGKKGFHFEHVMKENRELRKQLLETQLLTARSLYLNKFLAREDLSRNQKQKIVEYLDSARTIAEAKEVYNRVKRVLETKKPALKENKETAKIGSSSQATGASGSAKTLVTENRGGIPLERLLKLSGISKK